MQTRYAISPNEGKTFGTNQIRENFLIEKLFVADSLQFTYTHYDRVMVGGCQPVHSNVKLPTFDELKSSYFLERREMGIINVGGKGRIEADGKIYELAKLDCLYVGKGVEKIVFESDDAAAPALFYLLSSPAHQTYATTLMTKMGASPVKIGNAATSNERTIYKYIHINGIASCQLVMGLTVLETVSVWNTMPAHVHDRRMEAYFYFDLPSDQRVLHLMGQPQETRHIIVANHQAVVSPPWSVHSGCGTSSYSFIWGMAGENKDYADMDFVAITDLK